MAARPGGTNLHRAGRIHHQPTPAPFGGRGRTTNSQPPKKKELGEPRQPLLTLKGSYHLAFAGNAPVLASADQRPLRVWDLPAGKERCAIDLEGKNVSSLALSPDGKTVAAALVRGVGDTALRLYDATTGKERLPRLEGQLGYVQALVFSPDGKTLAAGNVSAKVSLWDVATGKERTAYRTGGGVTCVAYSRDGKTLAAGDRAGKVALWDAGNDRLLHSFKVGGHTPWRLAFSADGRTLLTVSLGEVTRNVLEAWEVASGQAQPERAPDIGPGRAHTLDLSPDGKWLALGLERERTGTFELREAATGKVRAAVWPDQGGYIMACAFSSDGRLLATGGNDGTVKVWRVEDLTR